VERITAPDPQRAWLPLARRKALDLCAREKFDAVLVSVPPFSSLQIGVAVKRRYPHMSLISDFRDEWINYYLGELGPAPTPYRLKIAVEQERQAVEASDFVIAVTPQQRRLIRERHPREPEEKFITIFNGYDPDVFGRLDVRSHGGPRLRVAYIGTVYGHAIHSPGYWLEALDGLEEAERESLETRFVGRMEADAAPFLASARTPVSATGFLPQDKALNEMMQADALLLLVGDLNHVPAKLFEYMASGKPILCLTAPGGVAARLVEEARAGWTADLRNPAAVRALARKALEWKQTGCGFDPDKERIASFARPALVAQMARATGLEGS
jgi:glycosyltransferase involved in cell wall biosynthesis